MRQSSILSLASVNNHGISKDGSAVIFTLLDCNSFGLNNIELLINGVVNYNLRGTFSELTLPIEHKTSTKVVNLVTVWTC